MYIESLRLRNYRNYVSETIHLNRGMNLILGDNGEGKTNILEAVYLLSTTRSHRNDDDRDLILFDQEFGSVEGIINTGDSRDHLQIVLHKSGKSLFINKNNVRKNSEFIGRINAVLFTPTDMDLFNGAPRIRRRMIDIELGKLYSNYMLSLSSYLKSLKDRNSYLKNQSIDSVLLDTYTEMLLEPQKEIIKLRSWFVREVNTYLEYFFNQISDEQHSLRMDYICMIDETDNDEEIISQLKANYQETRERDLFLRQTNTGVHRDDYIFYLDERNAESFSSQGQKRMIILALKLSFMQIIYKIKREYPVILLDDVFSELDIRRRNSLLNLLPDSVQTIITTTDIREADLSKKNDVKVMYIRKGRLSDG